MNEKASVPEQPDEGAGSFESQQWTSPRPQEVPAPTYAPAVVAIGIVCLLWGLVTTYAISLLGAVLLVIGLIDWIGGMLHGHESFRS